MESILGREIEFSDLDLGLSEDEAIEVMKDLTGTTQLADVIPEVWSREIERQASAVRVMRGIGPQVVVNTDLKDKPGDVVHIAKKLNLTPAVKVNETADIIPEAMAFSEITLEPTEWAKAVQISRKGQRRAYINTMEEGTESLGTSIADAEDIEFHAQAIAGATIFVFPDPDYTLVNQIGAADILEPSVLRRAMTALRNAKAPKPYVVVVHTEQEGDLLDSERFIDASKYGDGSIVRTGELGKWLGMPIVASQNVYSAADGKDEGSGPTTVYRALMMAPRSLAIAIKSDPDFEEEYHVLGRKTDLASVYEMEIKALNDDRYAVIYSA